jgi:hypothetical protein
LLLGVPHHQQTSTTAAAAAAAPHKEWLQVNVAGMEIMRHISSSMMALLVPYQHFC